MASNKTSSRKPFTGDRKALIIAFDVGTTFSGVSYAILEPGEVPKTLGVTRYPGQEHVTGNTKIPSLLYYDRAGKLRAAGAEAESSQILADAEDEGWYKVELFKLRLRPKTMHLETNGIKFSPLPPGKSTEHVFGDFLRYLFSCTRRFIEDSHAAGDRLWKQVESNTHFVLSHPNGWEGPQQSRMRRAAIYGGLIPDTDEGKARIRFVTEGEASMHACIHNGLAHDVLRSGNGFIVADAGGGTLDISSYILRGMHPLTLEEVAPPDCIFAGAVFVSRRCRVFLEGKLRDSKYGTSDALEHITKRFDETTKRLFRDKNDTQYIHFGSPLDRDLKNGIRNGQLKLTGEEVASFFEPSIQAAVASIRKQIEGSRGVVKAVWLVGGFAASPWLFSQMQDRLAPLGVTVNRPDSQTSKAVADGAIGFFCDHHVSARMSRYMYGVEYLREINNNDEEHRARQGRLLQLPSGPRFLPDAFDCILAKGIRVKESSVFSRKYYTEVTKLSTLSVFEIEIWCYRGGGDTVPQWIDRNSDSFASLCFVRADLSKLSNSAQPKTGPNGQTYWTVVFSIEIHFGLTEFKARMKWNEDGKTRYGPASIVFNEKGVRSDEDEVYSIVDDDSAPPSAAPSISSRQPSASTATTPSPSVSKSASMTSDAPSASTVTGRPPSISSSASRTKSRSLAKDVGHTPQPSHTPSSVPTSSAPSAVPSRVSSTISSSAPRSRTTSSTSSRSMTPASAPPIAPSASGSSKKELPTITEQAPLQPPPAPAPAHVVTPVTATPSPTDTLVNATSSVTTPIKETPPPPPQPERVEPPLPPPVVEDVKLHEPVPMPAEPAPPTLRAPSPRVPTPRAPTPRAPTPRAPTPRAATPRAPTPRALSPVPTEEPPAAVPDPAPAPTPAETPAPIAEFLTEPVMSALEPIHPGPTHDNFSFFDQAAPRSPAKEHELLPKSPAKVVEELPKSPLQQMQELIDNPVQPPVSPKSPAKSIWGQATSPAKPAWGAPAVSSAKPAWGAAAAKPAWGAKSPLEATPTPTPAAPAEPAWGTPAKKKKGKKAAWGAWGGDDAWGDSGNAEEPQKSPAKENTELPTSSAGEAFDFTSSSLSKEPNELASSLFPSANGDADNEDQREEPVPPPAGDAILEPTSEAPADPPAAENTRDAPADPPAAESTQEPPAEPAAAEVATEAPAETTAPEAPTETAPEGAVADANETTEQEDKKTGGGGKGNKKKGGKGKKKGK